MSDYYLCYECENFRPIERQFDCDGWCVAGGKPMKVMHDHHGRGGRRYDEPKDVCEYYVTRIGEACTERT